MKIKGINYNAGIKYTPNQEITLFTKEIAKRDFSLIKELNCNAIRIYGSDLKNLFLFSEEALEQGFEVWISPRLIGGGKKETISFVKTASKKAEILRKKYKKVVFILGNELMLDSNYVFNQENIYDRNVVFKNYIDLKRVSKSNFYKAKSTKNSITKFVKNIEKRLNNLIISLAKVSKKNFHGKITYASLPIEEINWNLFDIISINYYKNKWNKNNYSDKIQELRKINPKIAITEFGVCSYKGASEQGGSSYNIVNYKTKEVEKGIVRSEEEQSEYIKDLIKTYKKENVYASFIFDFKEEWKVYSKNPKKDLDMASFGIIGIKKDDSFFKKKSFNVIKQLYSNKK